MTINQSRIATIIFDSGKKLSESEYKSICESIESDSFSSNKIVNEYKKKDSIFGSNVFVLNDGTRALISESMISKIADLKIPELDSYIRESKENLDKIIDCIIENENS